MTQPPPEVERALHEIHHTRQPRPPDLLFEALLEVAGWDLTALTASERGRTNKAAKELRQIGATPEDVRIRAAGYRQRFPNAVLTPLALARNWSAIAPTHNTDPPRPRYPTIEELREKGVI